MTARVNAADVKKIISTSIDDGDVTVIFIDAANTYINEHLLDEGFSEAYLAKIELYLSAHFLAITEESGAPKFTKLGDASDSYETDMLGPGLASTRYGMTALALDTSGTLASIGSGTMKAEFRVI